MKGLLHTTLLIFIVFFMGCNTTSPKMVFDRTIDFSEAKKYSIEPFTDLNQQNDQLRYPESVKVVRGAFETALLNAGQSVVKKGKEDAVIKGSVTAYYKGSFLGRYTTVGIDVKAIDSKTGQTLWKGIHSKTTKFKYDYEPSKLAVEVAQELLEQMK